MRIEFVVNDIPPKKHGEKSMWDFPSEVPRIIALREAALKAMEAAGRSDCFHTWLKLEFTLFVPRSGLESIGDLDNFITGICDGLQAAHHNVKKFHDAFLEPGREAIHPRRALMIENDSKIISITARKEIQQGNKGLSYQVVVSEDKV